MKKAILAASLIGLLAVGVLAAEITAAAEPAAGTRVGYALLDKLVGTFKQMAETGTGGRAPLEKALADIMAEVRQAKAQKQVDSVFFWKFNRLMMIIKLAIVDDIDGILGPLIEREVGAFIEEVKGERFDFSNKAEKAVGIGAIADAMAYEILNIRLYLDTLPKREAMLQDFYSLTSATAKDK